MTKPVKVRFSKRYGAYYSVKTGVWRSRKCSDESCKFCSKRPARFPIKRKKPCKARTTYPFLEDLQAVEHDDY